MPVGLTACHCVSEIGESDPEALCCISEYAKTRRRQEFFAAAFLLFDG